MTTCPHCQFLKIMLEAIDKHDEIPAPSLETYASAMGMAIADLLINLDRDKRVLWAATIINQFEYAIVMRTKIDEVDLLNALTDTNAVSLVDLVNFKGTKQ